MLDIAPGPDTGAVLIDNPLLKYGPSQLCIAIMIGKQEPHCALNAANVHNKVGSVQSGMFGTMVTGPSWTAIPASILSPNSCVQSLPREARL